MTAIRTIRPDEAEAFLQLLCDVFGLDFNRAYDLYFQEPYFDVNRKWAIFEGAEMISVLTTTPLKFGWGDAVGIAGVATKEKYRNEGYAKRLLLKVLSEHKKRGEEAALLFATETKLYENVGFEGLDRVVRGELYSEPASGPNEGMPIERLEDLYDKWSFGHRDRLRRDEQRWKYWKWHFRQCAQYRDGYLCFENGMLREALYTGKAENWPVPEGSQWMGLSYMTDQLEIPLRNVTEETILMGYNVPGQPQMFLTDQF